MDQNMESEYRRNRKILKNREKNQNETIKKKVKKGSPKQIIECLLLNLMLSM